MSFSAWNRRFAAALAVSVPLATAMPAAAQQDQAQAEQTWRTLAPQADERAGDPAFDYALGIAALDSGRYGEAIIAL
jgi:Flp pilus assembly protein TadD